MTNLLLQWLLALLLLSTTSCKDDTRAAGPEPTPAHTFRNPVMPSAADPWVAQQGEWYYVTHTTGNSLRLYRTKAMSALNQAEAKTVWNAPATGLNSRNIWAPEIHFVNNRWYCYYAADDGDNQNHRIWVLENTSSDPFTGTWTDKGKLMLADDKWAIDGTLFSHKGQLYFTWSGWEGNTNIEQAIYITKMADPLTPTGNRVRISRPTLDWEKQGNAPLVNEGPQFLTRGNQVYIAYSASGCWTDEYALGLLTSRPDSDLLDPATWSKSPAPVFTKNVDGQAFGPGHCTFFTSPDGSESWILYHANPQAGQGCGGHRSARMQPFTWSNDNVPVFNQPLPLSTPLTKPAGE